MRRLNSPKLLNHGQFRNVYCGVVDSGRLETFVQPNSHIVIKTFKDK
jgi:hypothetical protein